MFYHSGQLLSSYNFCQLNLPHNCNANEETNTQSKVDIDGVYLYRVKANNANLKIDLYVNGDLLDQNDDRKLISQLAIRDKTVSQTSSCDPFSLGILCL